MERSQFLGEPEFSMEDALALSLRRIMGQNGQPRRSEYRHDPQLYEVHARQWDDAKRILEEHDRNKVR